MESKRKKSLIKQLKDNGKDIKHSTELIDNYILACGNEKKAQSDVEKRGSTYYAISSKGKKYEKNNPSVRAAVTYNKQKLSILRKLGLTAQSAKKIDN